MNQTIIQRILIPCGRQGNAETYREWEFCMAYVFNTSGELLWSGLAPAGNMIKTDKIPVNDTDVVVEFPPMLNPSFVNCGNNIDDKGTGLYG